MTRKLRGADATVEPRRGQVARSRHADMRRTAEPVVEKQQRVEPHEVTDFETEAAGPAQARGVAATGTATADDLRTVRDLSALVAESTRTVMGDRAWGDVDAQLARIKALDTGPRRTVPIIGGGVAGLVAAYVLEKLGHKVRIIDANDHLGGRIDTQRFADGTYHEKGAMRIPASHDYTRYFVKEMGLTLQPFISSNRDAFLEVDGKRTRFKDSREQPERVLSDLLQGVLDSLTPEERASLYETELSSQRLKDLDQLSLEGFLRQKLSPDMVELIGDATTLRGQYDRSLLFFLRQKLRGNSEGLEEIVGGMDRLTSELASRIDGPVELKTKLQSVERLDDGKVRIVTEHEGKRRIEVLDEALMTLPFSVLRGIELSGFSDGKMDAVKNLSYEDALKVIAHTDSQPWEKQDHIHGGSSHTDGISGATYYPTDHAVPGSKAAKNRDGEGPAALLASYVWGPDARKIGDMPLEEAARAVMDSVIEMNPGLAGHYDQVVIQDWRKNELTKGAFAMPLPGQNHMYQEALKAEGNLHFAGEHTSLDQGWIQGAIISALRAVEEIVTSPPPAAKEGAKS